MEKFKIRKDKTNRTNIRKKELQSQFTTMLAPTLNIINGITNRSRNITKKTIPFKPFDNLYSILCRKELLIQVLGNINSNKGP
jgi:hypothetical protein